MPLWYHRIDDYKWIHGSIRQDLQPDERSIWADLLALAGLTREPRRGYIERSKSVPYPKNVLICMLNVSEELFDRTLTKCVKEGRLKVYKDGTMFITNWNRYNDVKDWHDKKQNEQEKKEAKSKAITRIRRDKNSMTNNIQSNTRALNTLNGELMKINKNKKE